MECCLHVLIYSTLTWSNRFTFWGYPLFELNSLSFRNIESYFKVIAHGSVDWWDWLGKTWFKCANCKSKFWTFDLVTENLEPEWRGCWGQQERRWQQNLWRHIQLNLRKWFSFRSYFPPNSRQFRRGQKQDATRTREFGEILLTRWKICILTIWVVNLACFERQISPYEHLVNCSCSNYKSTTISLVKLGSLL